MVEGKMQIFRPDRSDPTVRISESLRKTKFTNKHSCVNQKISVHT